MRAVGIILAGGNNDMRLKELTINRAAAALPIGGCFRTIDFALSNMTASGIDKVAVITQYNIRSLHDHLASEKWWNFGRKKGGLFIFAPFLSADNTFWFRGTSDSIYQNITFLKRSNEEFVVIASGDCVYKMDYNEAISFHIEKDADITVICKSMPDRDLSKFGVVKLDENKKITEFEEKPIEPQSDVASLGIYIISRELLIKLLAETVSSGRFDFVRDIIINLRKKLKIYGFEFNGYWSNVGSGILDYYNVNMDFLKKDIRDLFTKEKPLIITKPKDEPSVKFNFGAVFKNSLIGNGSIVEGYVENSVLFRRVFVRKGSIVKNSIVMENANIGERCFIENAILDKEVKVTDGQIIIGKQNEPMIIKKGSIV